MLIRLNHQNEYPAKSCYSQSHHGAGSYHLECYAQSQQRGFFTLLAGSVRAEHFELIYAEPCVSHLSDCPFIELYTLNLTRDKSN